MSDGAAESPWVTAALAASVLAVDSAGVGGLVLRARSGPVRDRWLSLLRSLLGDMPVVRVPLSAGDDELLGGLDLASTLSAGRPVASRGLLAAADGGLLMLSMAERVEPRVAAIVCSALDTRQVQSQRVGVGAANETRFGVLALDEGADNDERPPRVLQDRLAMLVDLERVSVGDTDLRIHSPRAVLEARARLASVEATDDCLEALTAGAAALGISSLRIPALALRVARVAAALAGRDRIDKPDLALAGQLVLGPRATVIPAAEQDDGDEREPQEDSAQSEPVPDNPDETATADAPDQDEQESDDERGEIDLEQALAEIVVAAATANLPTGLLDGSLTATAERTPGGGNMGAGGWQARGKRGRPAGVRRGEPGPQARLNVIETLRAAAPWQRLRRDAGDNNKVHVRRDDFRVSRYRTRRETATIFVVDASGSSAMHRLAEAKGAVELLLADCYVRRDQVALLSFRGQQAELLLPPTRSLLRAKRSLAGLPGGGGTPLAAGLQAALALAEQVRRNGATPMVVFLTDGRANIALSGEPADRSAVMEEALVLARQFRAARIPSIVVDTSPRARPQAAQLGEALGGRYLPLPHAEAAELSAAVQAAVA